MKQAPARAAGASSTPTTSFGLMADVLGLIAKWPRPGLAKTRLAAQTSPDFAVAVANALLHDSIERYGRLATRRILFFAPDDDRVEFAHLAGDPWELLPQPPGDLGVRMTHFFDTQFQAPARRVVLVGSDSPTLPLDSIRLAFDMLSRRDVVLGPATDGGFYLIGLARPAPALFAQMHWSRRDVLARTVDRLGSLSLSLLPPWYDIDTLDDWEMLRGHLRALRAAGNDPLAPRTEALAAT